MNAASAILSIVQSVTKPWAKQRKAEEREANTRARRHDVMTRDYRETIKDVAREIMEEAYLKASSKGTLPAHARQVMYAARGEIQRRTGRALDDQYFIQTLLVNYLHDHPEKAEEWDIVFDARGHFEEPHTDRVVPLGTIDVRDYLQKATHHEVEDLELDLEIPKADRFPTFGSKNRFGAILFVEKEGFMPLFNKVKLAERYDIAIMSTKGMSVTASRLLVDQLSAQNEEIPLLVLHDFDKSGFSILGTLQRDTRRYEFQNHVKVIDLGLRLEDVKAYGLASEDVHYGKSDPTDNLRDNGATDEEITFLYSKDGREHWNGYRGRRVELNAFSSGDFIRWIESKLKKHRIRRVIPDDECLGRAYRRAIEIELLNKEIEKLRAGIHQRAESTKVPRGLARKVEKRLKANPELSWDQALAQEVNWRLEEEDEEGR